jgi:hypothetical protein
MLARALMLLFGVIPFATCLAIMACFAGDQASTTLPDETAPFIEQEPAGHFVDEAETSEGKPHEPPQRPARPGRNSENSPDSSSPEEAFEHQSDECASLTLFS